MAETMAPPSDPVPLAIQGRVGRGVLVGLVCGAVAVGVAQLVAGIVGPDASPIVVVGGAAVDATPEWLKSFAIRTFGSNDKTVLLAGIGVVLAVVAAMIGVAALRRPSVGYAGLAVFGLIGVAAALTRPTAQPIDALPVAARRDSPARSCSGRSCARWLRRPPRHLRSCPHPGASIGGGSS